MTRVISVTSFKGGVGKSTLTENLAYAFTLLNQRVLVIDADRQQNSSKTLLGKADLHPSLLDVLLGKVSLKEAIRETRPHLFALPSDTNLETAIPYLQAEHDALYVLSEELATVEQDFDLCLIDQAGTLTSVMEAGLRASTEMLIPCQLEPYAVQGLFSMFEKLRVKLRRHKITNSGIIPSAVDMRPAISKLYLKELEGEFGDLLLSPVPTDSTVPKAQSVGMTVLEYAQTYGVRSRAATAFHDLAADLLEMGAPEEEERSHV